MPTEIPGLGVFDWSLVKVSMRVPSPSEKKTVVDHTMPGLAYLVSEAAKEVDGSIDACHDYAAATLIEVGREDELIAAMEKLVKAK
jgi:O-succinylbenzoate synthase